MPLPRALIEHQMPGRLRLRIPSRRGDAAFFAAAEDRLRGAPGLRQVRANPWTGGVLVLHAGDVEAIAGFARAQELFDLAPPGASAPPAPRRRDGATAPMRAGSRPRPLNVAAGGFAGLALYQTARGQVLGNAVESLWHAYTARAVLGRPWVSLGLAGLGLYQLAAGRALGPATSLALYALSAQGMARRAAEPGPSGTGAGEA
jgi:hypothetical protein